MTTQTIADPAAPTSWFKADEAGKRALAEARSRTLCRTMAIRSTLAALQAIPGTSSPTKWRRRARRESSWDVSVHLLRCGGEGKGHRTSLLIAELFEAL